MECARLTNISVAPGNSNYSSLNGVLFNLDQTLLIQFLPALPGNYVIPSSVKNIGPTAFYLCAGLTHIVLPGDLTNISANAFSGCSELQNSITIPGGVASIGTFAFDGTPGLTNFIFSGNAPTLGTSVFDTTNAVVYYYAGTTGWSNTYGGLPTVQLAAPFNPPQIGGGNGNGSISISSGNFSFNITAAPNQTIVIEASSNLITWLPIWTNTLSGTNTTFSDPQWTNYPARYYRAR